MKDNKIIKVTLVKSLNKKLQSHKDCVRGLGLRRIRGTRILKNTPEIKGMINKVSYLLNIEEGE